MGLGGIGPLSLLLILLIIVVLFGTKRIRSLGSDLGAAFKSFRQGLNQDDDRPDNSQDDHQTASESKDIPSAARVTDKEDS